MQSLTLPLVQANQHGQVGRTRFVPAGTRRVARSREEASGSVRSLTACHSMRASSGVSSSTL